jgi:regulator of replication initiation timing
MMALLRSFPSVRRLEDELDRTRRTLDSACRYIDQLEGLKRDQSERIQQLESEVKKEQDRAAEAFVSCARLSCENDSLRRRLNKTGGER